MEKKCLIAASKVVLILGIIGMFIPFFDESNIFEAIGYFFSVKSFRYIFTGINCLLLVITYLVNLIYSIIVLSSTFSSKKLNEEYYKGCIRLDVLLLALGYVFVICAAILATHLGEEEVKIAFGLKLVIIAQVISTILYLYTSLYKEEISTAREERKAYWFLSLPAILFYFAVMTFPSIFSVFLSFTNYDGGNLFEKGALGFVGFKNYIKVFKDQYFYLSLKNNLWIVLVSVFGQLPLGFFLAYIISRGLIKGKDFFQTMIYLPCVISTVVIGVLFQSFFSPNGAWTEIISIFNRSYEWHTPEHPIIPVLFVILWMYTGTYLIIFLSNLQKIDPEIIEAATIDGATEWQSLWHIIFPQLSGVFVISAILAISGSLKSFDLIYVMTGGGPAKQTYVLSLYMFDKAFKGAADYPMANTISTIMVVISLILIVIVKSLEKKFGAKEE